MSYNKTELAQLGLRLCVSNAAMMAAWFLLVPVPMAVWLAVFASHALASVEYAIQVPANAKAHKNQLGLVLMRAPQEIIMFVAFVSICLLAQQTIHPQQLLAFPLILLAAAMIVRPDLSRRTIMIGIGFILSACTLALLHFRAPHITPVAENHLMTWSALELIGLGILGVVFVIIAALLVYYVYAPALRQHVAFARQRPRLFAGLLLLGLIAIAVVFYSLLMTVTPASPLVAVVFIAVMCVVPNSFMVVAWYGHTQIKPRGFMARRPLLFKYLVAWGTAFLEYALLIPLLRFAHQYLSIFQVFGLMELSVISVFLVFAYFVSKKPEEQTLQRRHVALYGCLMLANFVFCVFGYSAV